MSLTECASGIEDRAACARERESGKIGRGREKRPQKQLPASAILERNPRLGSFRQSETLTQRLFFLWYIIFIDNSSQKLVLTVYYVCGSQLQRMTCWLCIVTNRSLIDCCPVLRWIIWYNIAFTFYIPAPRTHHRQCCSVPPWNTPAATSEVLNYYLQI